VTLRSARREPVPPPPLTQWQSTWRYGVALAVSLVAWVGAAPEQWRDYQLLFWFEVLSGVVAFVAYHYRRRYPLPITCGVLALSAVANLASGPALMSLASIATRRLWREIVPAAALNIVAGSVYFTIRPEEDIPWLVLAAINLLGTGVLVAIGMYVGARRELVATLRDRAERAETEQALRVAQARSNERARIAREMHDVLAHRISLVAMHAGALGYRSDLTPDEAAEAAGVIRDNAHRALADLREILGVLRGDQSAGEPERPQPTLHDLDALIDDERRAGATIRVRNRVRRGDELPESVGRNAYRIVQECLTNARKHAPNTTVDIVIAGHPGGSLILLVSNPMPVGSVPVGSVNTMPGAGLGLVGLAERAELGGGRLDHRIARGRRFVVRAQLPWPA
jgi:signal transduction histidine kinase